MNEAAPSNAIGRKLFILLTLVAAVIAAWTGGWIWLTGEIGRRMDDQLASLASRGLTVTCPDRTIGGWPFRADVTCSKPTFVHAARSIYVAVERLRVTALVYQPTIVISELDGPAIVTGLNGATVNAAWGTFRASLGLELPSGFSWPPVIRPDRLSIAIDGLLVDVVRPEAPEVKLSSAHSELHGRPSPDAVAGSRDLDVAVDLKGVVLSLADKGIGPEGADWSLSASARALPTGTGSEAPFLKAWADNGGKLDIRLGRMNFGGFALSGKGSVSAHDTGLVNGRISVIATGLTSLMAPGTPGGKGRAELLGLATAFTLFGKPVKDGDVPGRGLDMTIEQGRMMMGPTPLGRLPPLF